MPSQEFNSAPQQKPNFCQVTSGIKPVILRKKLEKQMKQDKFLIAILIGIILLVVVTVVVVLTRAPGSEQYQPDDTPAGVVHNYFLAIQRKEYEKAFEYLSDELENKPDLDQFITDIGSNDSGQESALKLGDLSQSGQYTEVEIVITNYRAGSVFDNNRYSTSDAAILRQDNNGQWRLIQFPYPYWGWQWNEEPRN
jgi:hypothetical protein